MAEFADYLTVKDLLHKILLEFENTMQLEIKFFRNLSEKDSWEVALVRIFEFRPDEAERFTSRLEKVNDLSSKHFTAALQTASFPESLW